MSAKPVSYSPYYEYYRFIPIYDLESGARVRVAAVRCSGTGPSLRQETRVSVAQLYRGHCDFVAAEIERYLNKKEERNRVA